MSRFLRYIVEETLAGRNSDIREYTLGVHVFDRGEDFNPRLDPIVRVQARNLRSRIARYYEGPGAEDPIRIELPKGTYVPIFHKRVVEPASTQLPVEPSPAATPSVTSVAAAPPETPAMDAPVPRYLIAAVILLAILIGIATLYFTQSQNGRHTSYARTVARITRPWGILGG